MSMYKGNNVFIQKLLLFLNMIILPVLIVVAWHVATSTGAMSTLILPKISTVLETLKDQLTNGPLAGDIGISLSRIAKGYALAVVVGILLGVLIHADIYSDSSDSNDCMGSNLNYLVWNRGRIKSSCYLLSRLFSGSCKYSQRY